MRYGKEKVREESRDYGSAVPNAAVRFDPARPVGPPPYLFLSTLTLTLTLTVYFHFSCSDLLFQFFSST